MTSTAPIRSRAGSELRRAFLDYFTARDHVAVPSSPLVPSDPTLLFTTAGMVQFKPYYTAGDDVPYTRAASVQKCLRLTDLDNVGLTPRHDTFFEMLGNFSFGPRERGAYFKQEAIAFAWEFVTRELGLPVERLHASVFEGEGNLPRDDEAIGYWRKVGLPESRIVALGRKDNFWGPAGGQGACGPSSEIYFDLGETRPAYLPEGAFWGERPGDPGDRFMEFWNLVFPQFDAQPDGTLRPLARPGIDTGMGLERLALILQGRTTIFETDLFAPLVDAVLHHRTHRGAPSGAELRDARIVADHMRALTFAIAEGVLPGNEGAGYVLRRLLRRAVTRLRSRRSLGIHEPVLAGVAAEVVRQFGGHYPELRTNRTVLEVVAREEASFGETYEAGLTRLEQALGRGGGRLSGDDAFMLHDTWGFPIELTEEIAHERGVTVDREGFERAMDEQRDRARAASKFERGAAAGERAAWHEVTGGRHSEFLGYTALMADGLTLRRWREHGRELELVFDRTPCYAESGGQVADRGRIEGHGIDAELCHVFREDDGAIVHRVRLEQGTREALLEAGARGALRAVVDPAHRLPTQRHHTATHLLHAALRSTLGTHVRQAGSLVAPDRLRFDYTHFEAPAPAQLERIESLVGDWVLRNREVHWEVMPIDRAKALGAMALFGEKYGAEVRMVTVEGDEAAGIPVSRELCGGTHVSRTGDIGAFVLVSDGAIASGVRRVEALCGAEAMGWLKQRSALVEQLAQALQVKPEAVPAQVEKLRADIQALRKAQSDAARGGLEAEMERAAQDATTAPGGRWVVAEVKAEADTNAVREAADRLRATLGSGAAVLALQGGGKLTFIAAVTDDLVAAKKLRADELVRKVAQVTGGSGGGKPHLALAGGKDASKLGDALDEARRLLAEALGA